MRTKVGPFTYEVVIAKDALPAFEDKTLGLDIETYSTARLDKKGGLDPYRSKIRLVQIYDGSTVYLFDLLKYPDLQFHLSDLLKKHRFIAHNGCFEIKMLKHHFGWQNLNIDCSMLMAMLIDRAEHSPFEPEDDDDEEEKNKAGVYGYARRGGYGLDNITAKYFNISVDKSFQTSDWSKTKLLPAQYAYAALDAVLTYELGKLLSKKIVAYKMFNAYKLLREMQHVITDMELNGMGFDQEYHFKLTQEWGANVVLASGKCRKSFGDINPASTKQLGEWLTKKYPKAAKVWPRTEKGALAFGRNKMLLLQKRPKEIDNLLEYKKWQKLFTTYGEALIEKRHPITNRIHCSFFLGETRTGRLSSRDPNLQNQPRDGELRKVFRAAEGSSLVIADFSQIEMRVAGELSKDGTMLKAFRDGTDLHKAIVSAIAGKSISKVTDEERQLGKALNFGLLFGMGPKKLTLYAKLNYGVELTEDEAYEAWRIFHESMYPKYSAWCQVQRRNCERLGYVRTPMGRMRKLEPDEVYTKAINTPVQGGAAEVAYKALVKLRRALPELPIKVHIINMVHDEIILEATKGNELVVGKLLVEAMKQGYLDVFPNGCTKGLAEAFYGETWYDCKHKETRKPCL